MIPTLHLSNSFGLAVPPTGKMEFTSHFLGTYPGGKVLKTSKRTTAVNSGTRNNNQNLDSKRKKFDVLP